MEKDTVTNQSDKSHTGDKSNKAHMLVAMLGQEFTKSADHPFFEKLSSIVATPDPNSAPVPKGALDRLLASLPAGSKANHAAKGKKKDGGSQQSLKQPSKDAARSDAALKTLGDQHPAVIAHYLVNNAPSVRMEVINSLKGPTARQAAVYFTRFLSRIES